MKLNDLRFEWDENKNEANIEKHKISFVEAMTVFDDDNALYKPDIDHSKDEERFIILGISQNLRLLVVCHCYRESDTVIRIISARKATKQEWNQYGGELYEG
ncbi:MAG: BrnT family toxin [Oscillospiraceae bacterium]|nr:BrnT family toxin [Oscillospiraceae bacterium]